MKLPSSFTDYTRALLGVEEYEKLAAALEGEQPVSIRLYEDKFCLLYTSPSPRD